MAITRLSGGTTPPNGSDPRTFPAIWNDAVDDIEALELPITADRIADGAVTAPKLAKTAGAVMVFDDATARATAIPTPVEGMTTYLKDTDLVEVFDGSDFVPVAIEPDPPAILQVVQTVKTDTFSMSGLTFVDVPGLSVTITPTSATNKIFVLADVVFGASDGTSTIRLARDSTEINLSTTATSNQGTKSATVFGFNARNVGPSAIHFLDSPSTTSATVYKIRINCNITAFVNRHAVDNAQGQVSSITVMEVAG